MCYRLPTKEVKIQNQRGEFMIKRLCVMFIGLFVLCTIAFAAAAEEASTINSGDTAWVLTSAALVMMMTPALGFFYGGMVRKKNVLTILTQSFIIIALVSIIWVLIGYTLAFGPDNGSGFLGNLAHVGLRGVGMEADPNYSSTIPALAFMIFQAMFAIITPALIIGAFADRMKFAAFILFIIAWSIFVYAPVAHWVWGVGGWIRSLGMLDFAGGTVVHITAGVSALAVALLIGKRVELNAGSEIRPHDITKI